MQLIYFDNYASTRPLDKVSEAMEPYLRDKYYNPSSSYSEGEELKAELEEARTKIKEFTGADEKDSIIFTSCATEANNQVLKAVTLANKSKGNHIIISAVEHYSILHPCRSLEKQGYSVTYLPVDSNGLINPDDLKKAVRKETVLISIMHANGEIGTVQPVEELARIAKENGIIFHTDAVALFGYNRYDLKNSNINLLSANANNVYGPKGIGFLYVKKGTRVLPLIEGGIQEGGFRAGLENVPAIIGFGKACEIASSELDNRIKHTSDLQKKLIDGILRIPKTRLNGHPQKRTPYNANISIEFIEGESMLLLLGTKGILASSGSACSSKALKASYVLQAIGLPHEVCHGSLMFSLGIYNTEDEIDYLLAELPPVVEKLRKISPLK